MLWRRPQQRCDDFARIAFGACRDSAGNATRIDANDHNPNYLSYLNPNLSPFTIHSWLVNTFWLWKTNLLWPAGCSTDSTAKASSLTGLKRANARLNWRARKKSI